MKNFLFDENYLFEKPFFINKFINGSGYKNLQLRIEESQNTTYFIKLNSLKEYFYKNKTMLIFSSTLKEDNEYLINFLKTYPEKNFEYKLTLKNVDMFGNVFIENFSFDDENFNFIFNQKDNNEIEIKFYLLVE